MYEMIKTSFPKENISLEDLKPYFFPTDFELKKKNLCLIFRKLFALGCEKTSGNN